MELESAESHLLLESARRRVEIAAGRLKAAGGGRKSVYRKEQDRSAALLVAAARRRLASYSTADYEAAYNAAKLRRIRVSELVDKQVATAAELDAARREEANEQRNMKATNETLARLKDELENAVSHQTLVELQAAGPTGEDSSLARLELEQAQQDLQILERRVEALRVTSPFTGVLLSGLPNAGERLDAGAPLARVADDAKLLLVAAAAPEIARHLPPGSSVQVRLPGDPPQTASGTVLSNALAPEQGDGGYVIRVSVAGARSSALLAGGGGGAIEIQHEEKPWPFRF